ncbi:MAG: glucosylceramidase, partial [Bacteroidales bacterium]|nr:glucosylceramidase [Bacteroidales bacterium]
MKTLVIFLLSLCFFNTKAQLESGRKIEAWVTTNDRSSPFKKQAETIHFSHKQKRWGAPIVVDDQQTYQTIDGFGFALTGGSAEHLIKMQPGERAKILEELFSRDENNIGVSYIRLSIGASDLNSFVFSYNDLKKGETDYELKKFSLSQDLNDVVPVMKEILNLNPDIRILGSPWSAPTWMKTNEDVRGGKLKEECYDVYARYFVKYILAMQAEGITIDAITIQNEPLHPGNNPSMFMPDTAQADFIKKSLGPAFVANKIKTKIIVYDHNADRPDYPMTIYKDKEAARYVDGAAFHLYGGKIDALTEVHNS